MDTSLYVSLSSQVAMERRLNTIAHNVANISTVGFKAGKVRFEEVLGSRHSVSTSFVNQGQNHLSQLSGPIEQTGATYDFAIEGEAWFSMETPAGVIVSRDGRFKMDEAGGLVSMDGHAVLDAGGAPVQLNVAGGRPIVSVDGLITQDGKVASSIGLYEYAPTADFRRYGNSGIIAEAAPTPVESSGAVRVVQGYLEKSNVNPIAEMSSLIMVQRNFDNIATAIREGESSLKEAIRTLGSNT